MGLPPDAHRNDLTPYAGRWVARVGDRVVGQGGTPDQAKQAAKASRHKEIPEVIFVPTTHPFTLSPILEKIHVALPPELPIYLVGGAVRDALLSLPTNDFDFTLAGDAIIVARKVANALNAAFFPLDEERKTARLIFIQENGIRHTLDFATFRGQNLESDLRSRDFTINAIAIDVNNPQELLDPLGGVTDLLKKKLRACTPHVFIDDPVRILRAIRLAANIDLQILPETRQKMSEAVNKLNGISAERLRDEIFRILGGPKPDTSLRALDLLDALPLILPELTMLKKLAQPPPHISDAWEHTLNTLRRVEDLLTIFETDSDPEASTNLTMRQVMYRLGRYCSHINSHINSRLVPERTLRSLIFFAALYHDVGKSESRKINEEGQVCFYHHDKIGAKIVVERSKALRLSNIEINRLEAIIRHHMRPLLLAQTKKMPSNRAIYRFFRDTGAAGVDICLLALADVMAAYGTTLPQEEWTCHVDVVRTLLEAYWEHQSDRVSPPTIISGHDLIAEFGLKPGRLIGRLLEQVREAQVADQVRNREEAIALIREYLSENG